MKADVTVMQGHQSMPDRDTLLSMAEHHDRQALFHAKAACSDATWYHGHEKDTRRAAEHFTVAAALRSRAALIGGEGDV